MKSYGWPIISNAGTLPRRKYAPFYRFDVGNAWAIAVFRALSNVWRRAHLLVTVLQWQFLLDLCTFKKLAYTIIMPRFQISPCLIFKKSIIGAFFSAVRPNVFLIGLISNCHTSRCRIWIELRCFEKTLGYGLVDISQWSGYYENGAFSENRWPAFPSIMQPRTSCGANNVVILTCCRQS